MRRIVISLCCLWAVAVALTAQEPQRFELDEVTVAQLQDAMASGKYTARRLVELYTERIEQIDRRGPALRSVIELNPDALTIADGLDAERKAGKIRGPLHGIPILIKDNIDTGDRMLTTAGSLALAGAPAPRDAFIVERLRAAGAVILGKTNLSEWANFRSTKSTSGWSARGGQVRNPYVLDRNPCGSSSGTGAAVAANLAAIGVGTETDGSIVCPSNANNLVGIKPTVGLVSRSGIIPISQSQDTAGPMARTVADAALLLTAMTGIDARDAATKRAAGKAADYTTALDPGALKGARIGIARERYFGYSPRTDALVDQAIRVMKTRGAVIVDPANITTAAQLDECEFEILLYEFKAGLNAYFRTRGATSSVKSLEDLIAFNEREREKELPFFGQEILLMAQKKGPLTSAAYRKVHQTCRSRAGALGIDAVMKKHKLDAIVAPTGSPAWPIDLVNGDHFSGASSSPAAIAGYPNITVPAGYVQGLPVGVSFIGTAWTESKLIGYAYAYEQATKHRQPPQFLPTLRLDQLDKANSQLPIPNFQLPTSKAESRKPRASYRDSRPATSFVEVFGSAGFLRYLSYQARIRPSKSIVSAALLGGR
jgi:amidase